MLLIVVRTLMMFSLMTGTGGVHAQPVTERTEPPSVVAELSQEAAKLRAIVRSAAARDFLDAAARLPDPGMRTVWRHRAKGLALTPAQYDALPEMERDGFERRQYSPRMYYYTAYGSPLVFARVVDLLSLHAGMHPGRLDDARILDFGCGTIGHLRLLASQGADVTGVDVEPLFTALYSAEGDQGTIQSHRAKPGTLRLLTGRWPGDTKIAADVNTGGPYDVFVSKNTLKRGYIHPARDADPARLVHLGVDDATFVKAVYDTLKPGGVFLIYNISPAQNPADKPYIPHADGQCPFERSLLEKTGFEVLQFDTDDQSEIVRYWIALGYDDGKGEELTRRDLFAWWTLCRKPATKDTR